jgi:outer membrane protein assembly factor BamD
MPRFSWKLAIISLFAVAGCRPEFQLKQFTTNEALYQASLRQFERGKWADAVLGFEKLTLELAPRDTLAPKSFWYLGLARQHQRDYQLAAQAFNRIFESFPDDTLAERGLFEEGRSYQSLWTRPDRDASFGDAALATFTSLKTYYPASKLLPAADREIKTLEAMFAEKNYGVGMYYFRDKAFDSARLYVSFVLENWPDAPRARESALRLIELYRIIKYTDEANEVCAAVLPRYPGDAEVVKACPPPPTPPAVKPPTAGATAAAR